MRHASSQKSPVSSRVKIVFMGVLIGLSLVITSALNQETQTVQSRAAGKCSDSCNDKSRWISDCLRYNGSDKTSQCNGWYNAECSGCDNATPETNSPNTGTGSSTPYDPSETATNADVQNFCGANPDDARCCRINEWKNANLGTNFKDCSGNTRTRTDGESPLPAAATPTRAPYVPHLTATPIPLDQWDRFLRTWNLTASTPTPSATPTRTPTPTTPPPTASPQNTNVTPQTNPTTQQPYDSSIYSLTPQATAAPTGQSWRDEGSNRYPIAEVPTPVPTAAIHSIVLPGDIVVAGICSSNGYTNPYNKQVDRCGIVLWNKADKDLFCNDNKDMGWNEKDNELFKAQICD